MTDPLADLRKAAKQRQRGDTAYRAALHAAAKEHSQAEIGRALGVSRQAIQQQLRHRT